MKRIVMLVSAVILSIGMYAQVTYNFSNCGKTGRYGPSQSQVNSEYSGTSLAGDVTSNNGIQHWVVPQTGTYTIEVKGADGGETYQYGYQGGEGAYMSGEIQLNAGQVIKVLVGQRGQTARYASGGGGGSFVVSSTNQPLIIAGGGGGIRFNYSNYYEYGTTFINGNGASNYSSNGGSNGYGGGSYSSGGSGGGGFYTNGVDGYSSSSPGLAFINGGAGGDNYDYEAGEGGFGGGGGAEWYYSGAAGGGGGYSGGGAWTNSAGGGGSYNNGTNQSNSNGSNDGTESHGYVKITSLLSLNSITPNIGYTDNSLSVTISGTGVVYSTFSNTASFRFSQWSGSSMFYGTVTGENGNELYGDVSLSQNQTTGVYDLEVFDNGTNNWLSLPNSFTVTTAVYGCTDSIALNYDLNANVDNGSCVSDINITPDSTARGVSTQVFISASDTSAFKVGSEPAVLSLIHNTTAEILDVPNNYTSWTWNANENSYGFYSDVDVDSTHLDVNISGQETLTQFTSSYSNYYLNLNFSSQVTESLVINFETVAYNMYSSDSWQIYDENGSNILNLYNNGSYYNYSQNCNPSSISYTATASQMLQWSADEVITFRCYNYGFSQSYNCSNEYLEISFQNEYIIEQLTNPGLYSLNKKANGNNGSICDIVSEVRW